MTIRKAAITAASLAAIFALGACAGPSGTSEPSAPSGAVSSSADDILAAHDLAGLDAKSIIDRLDAMALADRPTDLRASIRPDELLISDGGEEVSVNMPNDQFYLSVAPYVNSTHDCYFHSLTTCTAELGGKDIQVKIVDKDSGEVLLDETRQAFDNGFVGLWLPRGIDAEMVVTYDGKSATTPISTKSAEDPTCLTTMQLT